MRSGSGGCARGAAFARRFAVVLVLGAVAVALTATPAFSHADILESDPLPGAVLAAPPGAVTLTFTEPVDARLSTAAVYDGDGDTIETRPGRAAPNVMRVRLPDLDEGAYIVTWRVSGQDAHPVQGVFTFQVGQGANATGRDLLALGQELLSTGTSSDRVVGGLYGVTRWGVFAGLALLLGGGAFVAFVWPAGRSARRARRIVGGGWLLVAAATLGGLLLYGPYASARGLGDMFDAALIGDTLSTRSGTVWAVRLVLLVLALVPLRALWSGRDRLPVWWLPVAGGLAIGIAATVGLAGHALVGDWVPVAVGADTIHVLAMAGWLGGLVVLAVALLPGRTAAELRAPLTRFSRVAFVCISALVATGAFQSWRQVGSLEGLRSTEFGRILVVKLVLVAAAVAVAAFSREYVLRLTGVGAPVQPGVGKRVPVVAGGADDATSTEDVELRGLRRSVALEVVLAVAVLATTALLVNSPPARGVIERGTADFLALTLESDRASVDITVSPGRAGRNDLHVSVLGPNGKPLPVDQVSITLGRPDGGEVERIELEPLDDEHYLAAGQKLRPEGEWRVGVRLQLEGDRRVRLSDTMTIR